MGTFGLVSRGCVIELRSFWGMSNRRNRFQSNSCDATIVVGEPLLRFSFSDTCSVYNLEHDLRRGRGL